MTSELPSKMIKEILTHKRRYKFTLENEPDYFWMLLTALPSENNISFDIDYLCLIKKVIPFTYELYLGDSTWHWHAEAISKGEYPLEQLPEHVRELARELYYH